MKTVITEKCLFKEYQFFEVYENRTIDDYMYQLFPVDTLVELLGYSTIEDECFLMNFIKRRKKEFKNKL